MYKFRTEYFYRERYFWGIKICNFVQDIYIETRILQLPKFKSSVYFHSLFSNSAVTVEFFCFDLAIVSMNLKRVISKDSFIFFYSNLRYRLIIEKYDCTEKAQRG